MAHALTENPPSPRSSQAERVSVDEILGAFEGKIKKVRVSIIYRFMLLVVALAMVALPLVYLGMIGAVGFGVVYHATQNTTLFEEMGVSKSALGAYLLPIVIGCAIIFFLIKPLLARPGRGGSRRLLKPENQTLLYAHVSKVCEVVGAPVPQRIEVDGDINAAAALGRGLFGFFGRDLTLVVGLPLAAGMNLRQFTGVLAHEFGHFSQGGAMRLTYLIHMINAWFARVVYQRDAWDEMLVRSSKDSDYRLIPLLLLIRLFIWLSRRVLWVLMMIGHGISCFMLRQMEYDADRYEARVAGSEGFEDTAKQLALLNLAWSKTQSDLSQAFDEKRLSDDLPAMIAINLKKMPAQVKTQLFEDQMSRRTGLFDSHPSDRARIKSAHKQKADGVFHDERPASVLFKNFEELCKQVTMEFYAVALGPEVALTKLVPTAELVGRQDVVSDHMTAIEGFFHGYVSSHHPIEWELASLTAPDDPRAVAQELKRARDYFEQATGEVREAYDRLQVADLRRFKATVAKGLMKRNVRVDPKTFEIHKAKDEAADEAIAEADRESADAEMLMMPVEDAIKRRLTLALRLLRVPKVRQRVADGEASVDQADRVLRALSMLHSMAEPLDKLRNDLGVLEQMLGVVKGRESDEKFLQQVMNASGRVARGIDTVRFGLQSTSYPFEHGSGEVSLASFLLEVPPSKDDVVSIFQKAFEMIQRVDQFYYRSLGALAATAEKVEQVLGLPPIPSPKPDATTNA